MQVETFEMTELDHEGTPECDEAAIALIESLGLDGQQKLLRRIESASDTTVKRCPYRKMTAEEDSVYRVICPQVKKLREYESGPIPLRVLQVAAHAVEFFEEIQVWSSVEASIKDPVLVGLANKNQWGTYQDQFILARWGDELAPFAELLKLACEKSVAKYKSDLAAGIGKLKAELVAATEGDPMQFLGKVAPTFYL